MRFSLTRPATRLVLTAGLSLAAALAQADTGTHQLGQHPAVLQHQAMRGIDTNTFRVGHPASPTTRGGHANQEHPAVTLARNARIGTMPELNANTFIVQPPASTQWTAAPTVAPVDVAVLKR